MTPPSTFQTKHQEYFNCGVLNEHTRTFVFQNQETQIPLLLEIHLSLTPGFTDLYDLLETHCSLKTHKVSIYDPDANKFVPLSKFGAELSGNIPTFLLESSVIMVRFKKGLAAASESESGHDSPNDEQREKKDRSKERTIAEAIEIVRQWRSLHLESLREGRTKLSLMQAAKAVGVSKKSLDDYYYQLRLGEFYSFDFPNNLNEKVGILRSYVKEFKPERERKNKNARHPRNLKIIEEFLLVDTLLPHLPQLLPSLLSIDSQHHLEEVRTPCSLRSLEEDSLQSFGNPYNNRGQSFEDRFFKNFEFLMDEQNDPFVQRDFSRKAFEPESSQDFFFF